MCMSSLNISITEDVYGMLKRLKRDDQSFSEVIRSLVTGKDLSRCYGLLKDCGDEVRIIEKEALRARKQKWKGAGF